MGLKEKKPIKGEPFKKPKFIWGHKNLVDKSNTRAVYINALKKTDNGGFQNLIVFAQS